MFNKPYIKNEGRVFTPVYVPNETYSFFINTDELLSDPNYRAFRLDLLDEQGNLVYVQVGGNFGLQVFFPYLGYEIYQIFANFIFPIVPDGRYYFGIWDRAEHVYKVTSNTILVAHDCFEVTCLVRYQNLKGSLFNFDYNNNPDFFNVFRLPLNQIDKQFKSDRETYRNVTGNRELRTATSFLDTNVKFESYWLDDNANEALAAMLEHDTIFIDFVRITNNTPLQLETILNSVFCKGSFDAFIGQYPVDPNTIEGYGDYIYFAGSPLNISDNIINANL